MKFGTGSLEGSANVLLKNGGLVHHGKLCIVNRAQLAEVHVETTGLDVGGGGEPVRCENVSLFQFDIFIVEEDDAVELVGIVNGSEETNFRSTKLESVCSSLDALVVTPGGDHVSDETDGGVEAVIENSRLTIIAQADAAGAILGLKRCERCADTNQQRENE